MRQAKPQAPPAKRAVAPSGRDARHQFSAQHTSHDPNVGAARRLARVHAAVASSQRVRTRVETLAEVRGSEKRDPAEIRA